MSNNEETVVQRFEEWVVQNTAWQLQKAIPIGELIADGRLVEISASGAVKAIIAYIEVKGGDADLRDLMTGLGQCAYYSEQSGCPSWLVLEHAQASRLLGTQKKIDPRTSIFDVEEQKLNATEEVADRMGKSRLKRKQEAVMFHAWEGTFTIVTTSPLVITTPKISGDGKVVLNIGQRVRGLLKQSAQTISHSLAEACKYSIYVEPFDLSIAGKNELLSCTKYLADKSGRSSKRDFYEIPAPLTLSFTVRSIHPKLTREVVENLLRQGGMFCGIGDSHTDGYHGRYVLK